MSKIAAGICGFFLVAAASIAEAAPITYVDATANTTGVDGNTTINGNLVSGSNTGTSATDGFWNNRALAGANGTGLWETDNSGAAGESTASLITTIALPGPGTYNLYAMFYSQGGNNPAGAPNWDLAAGVSTDVSIPILANYVEGDANSILTTTGGTEFTATVVTRHNGADMWMANLGQFTFDATQAAAVKFYINGPDRGTVNPNTPSQVNFGERTWYDGVGYEIVPEPTSISLLILGSAAAALMVRRRRATGC
jgi:hypothetical protein